MSLPSTGFYGPALPAHNIQPISKVLRLCGALVTSQTGDAAYPPSATTGNNDERGLGRLVVKQENMPYTVRVEESGPPDIAQDFNATQELAEKFIRCGYEYRNTLPNNAVVILPSVDKFFAMDAKLGDRGSVRVTAANSNPAGGNTYSFTALGDNVTFGRRVYGPTAASVDTGGWVLDWKIIDKDGNGTAIVRWIITGDVV